MLYQDGHSERKTAKLLKKSKIYLLLWKNIFIFIFMSSGLMKLKLTGWVIETIITFRGKGEKLSSLRNVSNLLNLRNVKKTTILFLFILGFRE